MHVDVDRGFDSETAVVEKMLRVFLGVAFLDEFPDDLGLHEIRVIGGEVLNAFALRTKSFGNVLLRGGIVLGLGDLPEFEHLVEDIDAAGFGNGIVDGDVFLAVFVHFADGF